MALPPLLSAHLLKDPTTWYAKQLPATQRADLENLPLETLKSLYPEVAHYGPNGEAVAQLVEDLEAHKQQILDLGEEYILQLALPVQESAVQAKMCFQAAIKLGPGMYAGTIIDKVVHSFRMPCSLNSCANVSCHGGVEGHSPAYGYYDFLHHVIMLALNDGFVDSHQLAAQPELLVKRNQALVAFNQALAVIGLNGKDYLVSYNALKKQSSQSSHDAMWTL